MNIKNLISSQADFYSSLDELLSYEENSDGSIDLAVAEIIAEVRNSGDAALLEYTRRFDGLSVDHVKDLEISKHELLEAYKGLGDDEVAALKIAAERIEKYHQHQLMDDWFFTDEDGHRLGQQINPLNRVGIYVPGGKASYPSSVLMNAIPAKVAGVNEVVMVVPSPRGELNSMVLAAAHIAGVDRVFRLGGAQAVAALAYGSETVPSVDKIVGPGNIYVATAKKQVFGKVGIDMIAGPSEILVLADENSNPDWVAMDLFSQAEHDEQAQAILISESAEFLLRVEESIERLLPTMERKVVIEKSLAKRGALIKVASVEEGIELVNYIAPEHLELSIDDAETYVSKVKNAGAIFVGRFTAEAFGDYCAGSNHVLPTSGSAKFSSPLGVYEFLKRTSVVQLNPETIGPLAGVASILGRAEGLEAHARSAEYRKPKS